MKKIELPKYTSSPNTKAHPYPYQIALQTEELIHATTFYYILLDKSAELATKKIGLPYIRDELLKKGMRKEDWNTGWDCLGKYTSLFERAAFLNVLVALRSNWDWYVTHLAGFIVFSDDSLNRMYTDKQKNTLKNITRNEITTQITVLERLCNMDLAVPQALLDNLREMSYVRNLGLHNRWEVDETYLSRTNEPQRWHLGEIRIFTETELNSWGATLRELINMTCRAVATQCVSAPQYPPLP